MSNPNQEKQDSAPPCPALTPPACSDFLVGICVALQVIAEHDEGVVWKHVVKAVGVDTMLQYAAFTEPAEWDLAGFSVYAKIELGRRKPRRPNTGAVKQ